ncbi:hypothetical protein TNCV_302251 [Trichonephila clavipes]|nr:hypothetical protein TNCV_302251 [Trichonephila clavipes]
MGYSHDFGTGHVPAEVTSAKRYIPPSPKIEQDYNQSKKNKGNGGGCPEPLDTPLVCATGRRSCRDLDLGSSPGTVESHAEALKHVKFVTSLSPHVRNRKDVLPMYQFTLPHHRSEIQIPGWARLTQPSILSVGGLINEDQACLGT